MATYHRSCDPRCRYCGSDIATMRSGSTVCRADACRTKRKLDW